MQWLAENWIAVMMSAALVTTSITRILPHGTAISIETRKKFRRQ